MTPADSMVLESADAAQELIGKNASMPTVLKLAELRMIEWAMREAEGCKNRAAPLLGINRTTLVMKVRAFGMTHRTDWSYPETYPFPEVETG